VCYLLAPEHAAPESTSLSEPIRRVKDNARESREQDRGSEIERESVTSIAETEGDMGEGGGGEGKAAKRSVAWKKKKYEKER